MDTLKFNQLLVEAKDYYVDWEQEAFAELDRLNSIFSGR